MEESQVKVGAAWLDGIGTILSAIGNTPCPFVREQLLLNIDFVGDVLQANAAAVMADLEEEYNLSKIGNSIDASGNVTEIAGNISSNELLANSGNAIQTVGTGLTLVDALTEPLIDLYYVYGSLLETIGLSMQTIAGGFPSGNKFGERLNTAGTWVQAIGSNIEAIGLTLEVPLEQKPTAYGYGAVGFYHSVKYPNFVRWLPIRLRLFESKRRQRSK